MALCARMALDRDRRRDRPSSQSRAAMRKRPPNASNDAIQRPSFDGLVATTAATDARRANSSEALDILRHARLFGGVVWKYARLLLSQRAVLHACFVVVVVVCAPREWAGPRLRFLFDKPNTRPRFAGSKAAMRGVLLHMYYSSVQ